MMYLSRVQVAPNGLDSSVLARLMQGDAYGNHQLLWRLFPDQHERPFLFRQEFEGESPLAAPHRPQALPLFYVLSSVEPTPAPRLMDCESKPFHPRLYNGQRLAFRLRANPTVARRDPGRKNSRRHDVLMDAKAAARTEGHSASESVAERMDRAAQEWLADAQRGERSGYRLETVPAVGAYQQHVQRRKGREIRFSSIDYEGTLRVTDPERFWRTLSQGIGHARAFGCGMWMIRPG
jgi:CRISPR system Cascade subunit CasE